MYARIYRIIHLQSEICYIGSTCNELKQRWQQHKSGFNRWMADKKLKSLSIFPFMEEYGIDQFKITLVKEYKVADKMHLHALEQLWVNKFRKTAVNLNNPFAIAPLFKKQYYKQYRDNNKEIIKEKCQAYRDANKETLNHNKREKCQCECGGKYTKTNSARHERSVKHQNWLAQQA